MYLSMYNLERPVKNNSHCRDEKLHRYFSRYKLNSMAGKMYRKSVAFHLKTILKKTASLVMYVLECIIEGIQYDFFHSFFCILLGAGIIWKLKPLCTVDHHAYSWWSSWVYSHVPLKWLIPPWLIQSISI